MGHIGPGWPSSFNDRTERELEMIAIVFFILLAVSFTSFIFGAFGLLEIMK